MAWIKDFVFSSVSDTLLPVVRPLLEDVVMEVLNDRQVPTRTDFREVRDLVNGMRGVVSSAGNTAKKLQAMLEALEKAQEEQAQFLRDLETRLQSLDGRQTG
jgi:dihydrodipicolinate synthase/N-acetylneuraminate lyase